MVARAPFVLSLVLHAAAIAYLAVGASSAAPRRPFVANVLDEMLASAPAAAPAAPAAVDVACDVPEVVPEVLLEPLAIVEPFAPIPEPETVLVEPVPPRQPPPRAWAAVVKRERDPAPAATPPAPQPPASSAAETARTLVVEPGTNAPPAYPPLARRRGWHGTVLLRVACDAAGQVVAITVLASSGHAVLDDAAAAAVRAWRFAGGPGSVEVPIEFRLAGP